MNDLLYYSTMGFYLGYSKEAVVAYLQRRHDVDNRCVTALTPTSQGTDLSNTGFIPSDRELRMTREEVIRDINSRRLHAVPFPEHDERVLEVEVTEFFEHIPCEELRLKWIAYLLYVVHNTTFLREVNYEPHLHVNPEWRGRSAVQAGRPG